MTDRRWCTFGVGNLECALPAGDIEEVVRHPAVTPVPMSAAVVRGLAQVRGRVVPVIGLRRCLGLGEAGPDVQPMHVITRTAEGPLSLEVDRIHDVVETGGEPVERPPDTLDPSVRGLIAGTARIEGRLVLLIDLASVIALTGARPMARRLAEVG